MRPVVSLRHLSSLLGVSVQRLKEIAADVDAHYNSFNVIYGKKLDKTREIHEPLAELKVIQRRIYKNILATIPLSPAAHGGIAGRSPRSNAEQHADQDCVVTLDVRDFFPSIGHKVVYRMLRRELHYGRDVARLLTRLTTLDGHVPQGAPTSTIVANLVLAFSVDAAVAVEAQRRDVRFTRFVDDVALSGRNAPSLINVVGRALSTRGLSMHRARKNGKSKLKISRGSEAHEVTGLTVNAGKPSVSQHRRNNIRFAIHALRKAPNRAARDAAVRSIRGRIAHAKAMNPGSAESLQAYLDKTLATLTRPGVRPADVA